MTSTEAPRLLHIEMSQIESPRKKVPYISDENAMSSNVYNTSLYSHRTITRSYCNLKLTQTY